MFMLCIFINRLFRTLAVHQNRVARGLSNLCHEAFRQRRRQDVSGAGYRDVLAPVLERFMVQIARTMLILLVGLGIAHAENTSLKTLLMPGKLVQGHAKLESDCNKCHVSFEKKAQDKLCVDCHKEVAADIAKNIGFHGRITPGATPPCKQCHTDHKGRDADIVGLDRDTFNHARTDFKLEGRHAAVSCDSCHQNGKKFREAPPTCFGCHEKDDRHRGALGKECDSCHSVNGWAKTQFDHAKTNFALRGAHRDVNCAACHPAQRFRDTPQKCVSCHAINDAHNGKNGTDCKSCHNETAWKQVSFDHNRDTQFALRGSHASADCNSCHRQGKFDVKLGMACIDCHRGDDVHKGNNGSECKSCHNESRWSDSKFDHAKDTKFALKGRHDNLACDSCHRGNVNTVKLQTDCIACHRSDDIHRGQQGEDCAQCHNENGWKQQVAFDHSLTKFPLIGLHDTLPCESCHINRAFKDTSRICGDCHRADDKHKGGLGPQCGACHNPSGWRYWTFDHDKQTQFSLTGAHRELTCASCHEKPPQQSPTPDRCYGCHAKDDRHDGRFGRNCAQCHTTDNFTDVRMLLR
jgi:hypothetical protein